MKRKHWINSSSRSTKDVSSPHYRVFLSPLFPPLHCPHCRQQVATVITKSFGFQPICRILFMKKGTCLVILTLPKELFTITRMFICNSQRRRRMCAKADVHALYILQAMKLSQYRMFFLLPFYLLRANKDQVRYAFQLFWRVCRRLYLSYYHDVIWLILFIISW